MESFLDNFNVQNFNNLGHSGLSLDLDINKLLVIILLLTGEIQIESIVVYPNDFAITLGTFKII